MWIVDDKAFNKMTKGDYSMVINLKQKDKNLSISDLFPFQFIYNSYDGFRKYYNRYLSNIINRVIYIDNDTIMGKILKYLLGI